MHCSSSQVNSNGKPKIVLSGVNLTEMGPLSVFKEALTAVAAEYSDQYEIIALVHRCDLFDTKNVTYLEFPNVKTSWIRRLNFEYRYSKTLSLQLRPAIWLSMHDMTPNVTAEVRAVYCHNAAPFYRLDIPNAVHDFKFFLFTAFYRFLYRINIHSNDFVIVQQNWIRERFMSLYGLRNVVVAHPEIAVPGAPMISRMRSPNEPYRFFYPAFPRTFKNPEVCLEASKILEGRGFTRFEVWLTFDSSVNGYAASIVKKFSGINAVRWLGLLPRGRLFELYQEADCLLFPSKLETWGLPITEFRHSNKPIIVADLAYAHETSAGYGQVAFFNPEDPEELAHLMESAVRGEDIFRAVPEVRIPQPYARNWAELWALLTRACQQ